MRLTQIKSRIIIGIILFLFSGGLTGQVKFHQLTREGLSSENHSQKDTRNIKSNPDGSYDLNYTFASIALGSQVAPDGVEYDIVHYDAFGLSQVIGSPSLPVRTEKLAIPEGAIPRISVTSFEYTELKDYSIFPAQEQPTDNQNRVFPFTKSKEIYNTNAFVPQSLAEVIDIQKFKGSKLAFIQVRPAQYNPKTNTLRLYRNLQLRIEFERGPSRSAKKTAKFSSANRSMLRNFVLNPESDILSAS